MKLETYEHQTSHHGHVAFLILLFVIGMLFGAGVGKQFESAKIAESQPLEKIDINKTEATTNSTTTDKTADWKTYTSDTYGFSFKYPKDWELSTTSTDNRLVTSITSPATVIANKSCPEGCGPDLQFRYYSTVADESENKANKIGAKTLAELIKNTPTISNVGSTTLGGVTATDVIRGGFSAYYDILVERNGHLYEVFFNWRDSKEKLSADEKLILSTFTFTK